MGYHQVEMDQRNRAKTASTTHKRLFVLNIMPYNLTNARATFQRFMFKIFQSHIGIDILVYLDDIFIFCKTLEGLYRTLDYTLHALSDAGLKCKPKKCNLLLQTIGYIGHVIGNGSYAADPEKIAKIVEWPTLTSGGDIESFLGLCCYYREHIPDFAKLADLLY